MDNNGLQQNINGEYRRVLQPSADYLLADFMEDGVFKDVFGFNVGRGYFFVRFVNGLYDYLKPIYGSDFPVELDFRLFRKRISLMPNEMTPSPISEEVAEKYKPQVCKECGAQYVYKSSRGTYIPGKKTIVDVAYLCDLNSVVYMGWWHCFLNFAEISLRVFAYSCGKVIWICWRPEFFIELLMLNMRLHTVVGKSKEKQNGNYYRKSILNGITA